MAFYEIQGPSKEYAIRDIKETFKDKKIPDFVIETNVQHEIDKYGGLGSFRGYCSSTKDSIIKNIEKDILFIKKNIQIIEKNIYFQNWMNHILYRPPDYSNTFKVLRYYDVLQDFDSRI